MSFLIVRPFSIFVYNIDPGGTNGNEKTIQPVYNTDIGLFLVAGSMSACLPNDSFAFCSISDSLASNIFANH
jgi:hypothetical protein